MRTEQPTAQWVEDVINSAMRRCEAARNAGGIAAIDVVAGKAQVPDGWELDMHTSYYLPPNVTLIG